MTLTVIIIRHIREKIKTLLHRILQNGISYNKISASGGGEPLLREPPPLYAAGNPCYAAI